MIGPCSLFVSGREISDTGMFQTEADAQAYAELTARAMGVTRVSIIEIATGEVIGQHDTYGHAYNCTCRGCHMLNAPAH